MDLNRQNPTRRISRPFPVAIFLLWGLTFSIGCPSTETQGTPTVKSSSSRYFKFTSDTSHYFSTSHEGKFVSSSDLLYKPNLEKVPFELGDWKGESIESDDVNILYHRFYKNQKLSSILYFMTVHGTNESQFHTPEVCYIGDGWTVGERKYRSLDLKGESFQVRYAIAEKNGVAQLILYWYLWPDSRRNITDGLTMFRLSVVIDSELEEAEQAALDFIHQLSDLELDLKNEPVENVPTPVLPDVAKANHNITSPWSLEKQKTVEWLKSQMVPNEIVQEPAQERRNLLISYRVPKSSKDYPYVFSKASTYDNALAIIAFSMVGEYQLAEQLVEATSRVLSPDGDLWFSFNTHNSWPNKKDFGGAIVRSGASAWLGYAITYYLKTRLIEDPDYLRKDREAMRHLKTAKFIADRILVRQIVNEKDSRYGLVTGGEGRYSYKWIEKIEDVGEHYIPGSVEWASIEHNIDIYFFLRDLARLSREPRYEKATDLLGKSILQKAWNESKGQLNRGHRNNGGDPVQALDCASWGAMFLQVMGEESKAERSLEATSRYFVKSGSTAGYKPYLDLLLYEDSKINAMIFPDDPSKNWNEMDMVWPEGTLGVAMAFIKAGKKGKAEEILMDILVLQDDQGGIPYATRDLRFQFSTNPSVASAAWFVMAVSALEDDRIPQLFWEN